MKPSLAAYHLKAIDYFEDKLDTKIGRISLDHGQRQFQELKEIFDWYRNGVEYHRKLAMGHLEKTSKVKKAILQRSQENDSLNHKSMMETTFKTALELQKVA